MSIVTIPAIIAIAVLLVPLFVKLFGRNAGWPIVAFFVAALARIFAQAPAILAGEAWTYSVPWLGNLIPALPEGTAYFSLRMDSLSLFFSVLALLIGSVVFIYSTRYFHKGEKTGSFYLLMTAFMLAVVLLVSADDVTVLFIAWEFVSLASFFLIARAGSSGEDGSVRTLILTFSGGLLLLLALALSVNATGSTRLSTIIASPVWSQSTPFTITVAVLVALAAFSKAAQLPFHAWLPEAMAAATPVSAFLHAAAVVKVGVYALMRFSMAFNALPAWNWFLIITGMVTAIMAAVFAVQKTDLKRLTAYSTVSQLGWIVAVIGVGTPYALAAATLHTAAHALFKSSLFMIIGVIDHQTGTRDIRRLGPLWKVMPFTFVGAAISVGSMAAIPPLLGFVSKEGMLSAFSHAPGSTTAVWILLAAATFGAFATFVYSFRYLFGAFIDGTRDVSHVKEAPFSLWFPAVFPGLFSIIAVLFCSVYDAPITSVVRDSLGAAKIGTFEAHTSLWHGINAPFIISVVVLVAGVTSLRYRKNIYNFMLGKKLWPFTGAEVIAWFYRMAERLGKAIGKLSNSYIPSQHIIWIFASALVLTAVSIFGPGVQGLSQLEYKFSGLDRPSDLIGLVLVLASVLIIVSVHSRLAALVMLSTAGLGVTWIMLTLGAPDVALTQLLAEMLITVIIALILRNQPRMFKRETEYRSRFSAVLATLVGVAVFFSVWGLVGRHKKSILATWYLENGPGYTAGTNVVNTILVEFRALDTMGELTVLGMTGVAIAAIIYSIPRSRLPGYGPGSTSEVTLARGGKGPARYPDVHKLPELAPFYSKNLRSTHLNSIPGRVMIRPLLVLVVFISMTTFFAGHNNPGGGFIASLITGAGIFMWWLVQGTDRRIGFSGMGYLLIAVGIMLSLIDGLFGYLGGGFLTPLHMMIGNYHFTTSVIFDLGVYFAVLGLITIIINLVGPNRRPGAPRASSRTNASASRLQKQLLAQDDSLDGELQTDKVSAS